MAKRILLLGLALVVSTGSGAPMDHSSTRPSKLSMTDLGKAAQSETDDKRMLRVAITFGEANREERGKPEGLVPSLVEKAVAVVKQVISSKPVKDVEAGGTDSVASKISNSLNMSPSSPEKSPTHKPLNSKAESGLTGIWEESWFLNKN
uniref:RxLR effector candidate protein n=1 Tax=Hyaloperonospora arabidopsidis (strain Emoy2) TaxID=559515 RepID=M4BP59_HYAAE